jgi:hypothetical protein
VEIRQDFKGLESLLDRLIAYQKEFSDYNRQRWSHLKNREDFAEVYNLSNPVRIPLEEVYSNGRDMAISMSYLLTEFNDVGTYPTFASFVNEVEKTVKNMLLKSEGVINKAEATIKDLRNCPFAVEAMLNLYKIQVNILISLENWVSRAKNTSLYKEESGDVNQSNRSATLDRSNIYHISTNFHGPVGQAQLQQATRSSTQSIEYGKLNYKDLHELLRGLKESIDQIELTDENKDELRSEIATIEV